MWAASCVSRKQPGTSFAVFKGIATVFTLNTELAFLSCVVWVKLWGGGGGCTGFSVISSLRQGSSSRHETACGHTSVISTLWEVEAGGWSSRPAGTM